MFARFDENPAMTPQDITDARTDDQTHGQCENSIPTTINGLKTISKTVLRHFKRPGIK